MRQFVITAALIAGVLCPLSATAFQGAKNPVEGKWTGWLMDGAGDRPSLRRGQISEMLITADRITARDNQQSMGAGSYRIDTKPNPGYLDPQGLEGVHRGRNYLGIYKLEGDTLTWCVANPGNPRPSEFRTRPPAQYLMIFTRQKS